MKFPVALELYSVRNELASDFEKTIADVSAMGYDGVEFAGLYDLSPKQVRDIVVKYNLNPIAAHVPIDALVNDAAGVLAAYKEIGCKYVAVPYLLPERRPGTDGFAGTIEDIKKIAEEAKKQSVVLLYHNHDFEFTKINGKYALDILYEEIDASLLQTELDTCWVNIGGEDPAEYLLRYSGRSPVLHLKDFYKSGEGDGALYQLIGVKSEAKAEKKFEFRPVGYGMQNFPSILKAAEKAGTKWVVVEQDDPSMGKTPLECAKMSIDYLRSL